MMPRIITARNLICWGMVATAALWVLYGQERKSKLARGDIIPLRQGSDCRAVFNGIAIDTQNNLVAMSDVNRKSLLSYARSSDSKRGEITAPRSQVFGPLTNVGFVAGIVL